MIRGEAPLQPTAGRQHEVPTQHLVSTLRIAGMVDMSQEEIAEEAVSSGYEVLAADKSKIGRKFSKTGIVRSTEDGFALETTKGFFKKKKDDTFILAGDPEVLESLSKRQNKKAVIKGVVDKNNVVTVETVKGIADLGFLTNWFTKGKVIGTVNGVDGKPLSDVRVFVKSGDGFTFSDLTDVEGKFEIKGLTPESYRVSLSKDGFQAIDAETVTVAKRKAVKIEATLAPVPAEAPADDEEDLEGTPEATSAE